LKPTPPLLMIAQGRRPRPRKAVHAAPKEFRLQTDVADVLRRYARPEWKWTHFPAGEKRDVRTGARLKRMGLQRGWPDFQLVSPAGQFYALELKRAGEDLTEEQETFRLWCIGRGIPHVVADKLGDALAALDGWGILSIKIARGAR
jgi:hypothetical protein